VSDDSFDASAKGRTTESGAALARGRDRMAEPPWRCRVRLACRDGKPIATSNLRERMRRRWRPRTRFDHAQNAGKLARGLRAHATARGVTASEVVRQGRGGFPSGEAQAWLGSDRHVVRSIWSSHSIGCSLPSSNRLTTFWFLIGPRGGPRKGDGAGDEDRSDLRSLYRRTNKGRRTRSPAKRRRWFAFAREQQFEVPREWVFEDDGYSGASLIRPGLGAGARSCCRGAVSRPSSSMRPIG